MGHTKTKCLIKSFNFDLSYLLDNTHFERASSFKTDTMFLATVLKITTIFPRQHSEDRSLLGKLSVGCLGHCPSFFLSCFYFLSLTTDSLCTTKTNKTSLDYCLIKQSSLNVCWVQNYITCLRWLYATVTKTAVCMQGEWMCDKVALNFRGVHYSLQVWAACIWVHRIVFDLP